jgi:hypothetical protein
MPSGRRAPIPDTPGKPECPNWPTLVLIALVSPKTGGPIRVCFLAEARDDCAASARQFRSAETKPDLTVQQTLVFWQKSAIVYLMETTGFLRPKYTTI